MASKLKPKIKKMWLRALRSGSYKQGVGALYRQVGPENNEKEQFCCLGVLCNLYAQTKKVTWKQEECLEAHFFNWLGGSSKREVRFSYLGRDVTLPNAVKSWAFSKVDDDTDEESDLVDLNDSRRLSFKKIANWIDKNL